MNLRDEIKLYKKEKVYYLNVLNDKPFPHQESDRIVDAIYKLNKLIDSTQKKLELEELKK